MKARLILNADDFGLTPGINRAVERLHRARALTSATLMAGGPAFDDAVAIARRNPTLGVGCHLVFTDGVPVSHPESIPSLLGADGKTFRPSSVDFLQALLRGTISEGEIALEAQAQIQKLQRAGIDVTHIDSHKHTHLFPAVARPVLYIAGRCGVRAFRYPNEPHWSRQLATSTPLARRAAQTALDLFEPRFRALVDLTCDEITTHGTLGIAATGTLNASILRAMIEAIQLRPPVPGNPEQGRVYELCCHPGFNDADLNRLRTRLRQTREIEMNALIEVIPEISQNPEAPELIHYGDLGVPGLQRASGQFTPNSGFEKVL
jgi:predicted glycoside hydrolase/deacetylase ChbG (UPF0249 family)